MFYQTQLQSIGVGWARDTSGRHLRFIGDLPVKIGDSVWTDGNVIFGHVPKKGTPSVPIPPPVIPVLGKNIRGYVTKAGIFKEYPVVADDWIVNNEKFFFHGESDINGKHIVDTNVSTDGKLLIAAGGEYAEYRYITLNNQMWTEWRLTGGEGYQYENVVPYGVLSEIKSYTGQGVVYGVNEPDENKPLEFYKDGQLITSISLKKYADLAENLALNIKGQIMAESNKDKNAVNYTNSPSPPNDFVAASYARVANVYVHDTGDWDAVIVASSYGYCFPYQTFDGSVFKGAFYANQDKTFSKKLAECMDAFDTSVFVDKKLPINLDITQYPDFTGDKIVNGEYTNTYKQYILDKCAYYIPRARFKFYRWFPMIFSAVVIARVHNDAVIDTIYSEAGGGTKVSGLGSDTRIAGYPFSFCWDERHVYDSPTDGVFIKHIPKEKKGWRFPLGDDFEFEADGLKFTSFVDTKTETRFEISEQGNETAHIRHYEAYVIYPLFTFLYETDSKLNTVLRQTGLSEESVIGRGIIFTAPCYNYIDTQNDVSVAFSYPKKISNSYLSGWFRYDDDVYSGNEIRLNHCFKKLVGDIGEQHLIGTKDGYLVKIGQEGTAQIICDDLKNFRLNELRNKSKALDI